MVDYRSVSYYPLFDSKNHKKYFKETVQWYGKLYITIRHSNNPKPNVNWVISGFRCGVVQAFALLGC
jgi:hypothetical protein